MIPLVGTIEKQGGKYVVIHDLPDRYQLWLAKLKVGTRVITPVKKFRKVNTPKQKAYLHGVVIPIAAACMDYPRHERDHVYEVLKEMYLKDTDLNGNLYTRQLREDSDDPVDTALASWFTDQIRDMVSIRYGIPIPDPDKDYDKGYIEEIITEIERG